MALPIKATNNQEGCNPVSSNCVIWQGPDIKCINLCKGDSISDVTAKLAQELCDLLDQLAVSGFTFNPDCFDLSCVTLDTFHDLVQFILDQLCELKDCCETTSNKSPVKTGTDGGAIPPGQDCPDCTIPVAQCFWYFDPFGNQVTTMKLADYAMAIGSRVCSITSQIASLQTRVNNQQVQIDWIINNYAPQPQVTLPTFGSTCLTDKIPAVPPGGISLSAMITAIQAAFCELRAATGMPTELLTAIMRQCVNLDTSPSMNQPGVNMGSLPGWITSGSYSTVADSINNMWITICDMRAAIQSIQENCCPTGCDGLVLSFSVQFTAPNTLKFFWVGSGTGFQDCNPAGSLVTITDAYGSQYVTRIPVIPNINGLYSLDLSGSPLNTGTNLTVHVECCVMRIDGSAVCERCFDDVVVNTTPCPPLTLTATSSTITYSITNTLPGNTTFQVDLRKSGDPTIIDTYSSYATGPGTLTYTFVNGILPGTTYSITVTVIINGVVTNNCPPAYIVTNPLACNPPINTSAQTDQYLIT